ncbi:MAG: 50S ribosomal protein L11 methyltransferase [Anaerolineales bacterium]|nr:50S ribosomal protein L11 methyltransferase [Anaerolineales bacterium]
MMDYTHVSVIVDEEAAEAVAEALTPFARGGVSIEQVASDLTPDGSTEPVLEDQITVSIYFPRDTDTSEKRQRIEEILWHLGRLYPISEPIFALVNDQDWANAWKIHYKPFRVGKRLQICPIWQTVESKPGDILILMDPGMAFGTGLHPTTSLCLEVIEETVKPGMQILDLGTGSGILAIASALLGASSILAVDVDEVAVKTARENCGVNNVANVVRVLHGSLEVTGPNAVWDIVLVNILAPVIMEMLERGLLQRVRPGGLLVFAGIIEGQDTQIIDVLESSGFSVDKRIKKDWVLLTARGTDEKRNAAITGGV